MNKKIGFIMEFIEYKKYYIIIYRIKGYFIT